jgi:hypothetical protein
MSGQHLSNLGGSKLEEPDTSFCIDWLAPRAAEVKTQRWSGARQVAIPTARRADCFGTRASSTRADGVMVGCVRTPQANAGVQS